MRALALRSFLLALALLGGHMPATFAQEGKVVRTSKAPFATVAVALEQAIADQKMGLVCHANAQQGAAARGVKIPGNQVIMIFRPDFAIKMLKANVEAGIEAPIRIYLYENPDGTATITYRTPSTIFGPYRHPDLTAIGAELDPIVERIVGQALATR
jgi:uncharacterized protein (DUF302 family)